MKFLYLSLIALGMTFIFSPSAYALHPVSVPVLSMKSNTIGHIYVEYSTAHRNQTIKLGPMDIYDANLTNHVPLNLTDLSVIPNQTSIMLDSNDTIVDYTVTAKNDLNGIYALPVDHFTDRSSVVGKVPWNATNRGYSKALCGMIPLVIGLNSSQVNQDVLDKFNFLNTTENCPVPLVDMWFTGSQTIERMPGTHLTGVRPMDASMDKDVYFPGDIATVRGYLYTNDTNVTIGLEKDHSVIVESKNVPVMQNRTFVSSFTIPRNYANTWSVMMSSKNAGNSTLYLNFESLPLKQYDAGIAAKDVVCKQGLSLIFKSEDSSPACVIPDTAYVLIERGWAKEISQTSLNTVSSASFAPCDTPYPQSNVGVAVLYMQPNSTGKICATYYNPNSSIQSSVRVFVAKDEQQQASEIIASAYPNIIPIGNSTLSYTIKTGNQAGLYGVSFFCNNIPLVVGYDNQSRIILDDFPWFYKSDTCLSQNNVFQITGLSGIHVKYITVAHRG